MRRIDVVNKREETDIKAIAFIQEDENIIVLNLLNRGHSD